MVACRGGVRRRLGRVSDICRDSTVHDSMGQDLLFLHLFVRCAGGNCWQRLIDIEVPKVMHRDAGNEWDSSSSALASVATVADLLEFAGPFEWYNIYVGTASRWSCRDWSVSVSGAANLVSHVVPAGLLDELLGPLVQSSKSLP